MDEREVMALMDDVAAVMKSLVSNALAPIVSRLDAIDAQLASLPAPRDGKDADEDAIVERVTAKMAGEIAQVRAAVDAIPIPEIPDVVGMIAGAIEALPKPQDGKSVTVEDVRPLIEECVSVAVSAIPKPKDGRGIKELLIDRDGNLVATMDDGEVWRVGHVVGKDADMPAIMKAIETKVKEAVAAIPKPKDGKDGVGFDDMRMEEREDGCFLVFERDETVKEFRVPVVIDRGVYSAGKVYRKGDGVTWAGSFWIAQEDTSEKPDTGKGWRLAVKKGRDGKDVK